jgi:two-component system phosphate regulon response regulator PhoB
LSKGLVLIIDDEKDLLELVRYNLEKEGFAVVSARDGEEGLAVAARERPDLIFLDLMLPGIDGLEVCRRLRGGGATARIPLIMLTAKEGEADRVVGLELGADDYVTKPFSTRELLARVKALLRRTSHEEPPEILRRRDLEIDLSRHEVSCQGRAVFLTPTEFRLLEFLAARPGRVFSRADIIDGVLGREIAVLDRTIDVHVMAVRRKLGACADAIETIRGIGYRFRDEAAGPAV